MPLVRKGNKELTVKTEQVQYYLDTGYDLVDEQTGVVISRSVPRGTEQLRAEYIAHVKKIEELEAQLADMTEKYEALLASTEVKAPKASRKKKTEE